MTIIAQPETEQVSNEYYKLFQLVPMEDEDGNTVNVKQSIWQHSKAQLESHKTRLQEQIASIDEKISAIDSIS